MEVTDNQSLLEFIESTTDLTCAYELLVLYLAIKLRNAEWKIDKDNLIDFFIDFYKIREAKDLNMDNPCNPLQLKNLDKTNQMINRGPIGTLLKVGVFKTFERFDEAIVKIIFENEEDILSLIRECVIKHYVGAFDESRDTLVTAISDWESDINEHIKKEALRKIGTRVEKIDLETMLKYLFQAYNMRVFQKLLDRFQISDEEFEDYLTTGREIFAKTFVKAEKQEEPAAVEPEPVPTKYSPDRIQTLTSFFQQMRDEAEEEEKEEKAKKKKKKK